MRVFGRGPDTLEKTVFVKSFKPVTGVRYLKYLIARLVCDLISAVASTHSYGATIRNNVTESDAFLYLNEQDARFRRPNKNERKSVLKSLNLPTTFSRAFDIVYMSEGDASRSILDIPAEDLLLVELKTTRKKLTALPSGFFFGATQNEFEIAKKLGHQYVFCFVSLHPESRGYVLLTLEELESKIKTKRIQYQINL